MKSVRKILVVRDCLIILALGFACFGFWPGFWVLVLLISELVLFTLSQKDAK